MPDIFAEFFLLLLIFFMKTPVTINSQALQAYGNILKRADSVLIWLMNKDNICIQTTANSERYIINFSFG